MKKITIYTDGASRGNPQIDRGSRPLKTGVWDGYAIQISDAGAAEDANIGRD